MRTSSSTGAPWGRSTGRPYSAASLSTILRSLRRSAIGREGYAGWYDPIGGDRRAPHRGRRARDTLAPGGGRADPLRARRAELLVDVGAVPRTHGRGGARPAWIRALGQAGRLRLLDPRLRPLPRGVLRPRRPASASRSWCTTGAGWRWRWPSASPSESSGWSCSPPCRCCRATAGTGWRARGELPCWASSRWASPPAGTCGARCRGRSPTAPTTSSIRAPSGRSCGSTARRPPRRSTRHGERLGELRCPALILWPSDDPYISAGFGPLYAKALGGETELESTDGGHWNWIERPELVRRVDQFLG